ncbi:glycosyltransferase family 4 protein [archaeon]|jgi:glycosyltransferase involved in cell wall biosynthesis|nr:glycosyltransferase family 4 protein [archaeon]MBT7128939.1 glycosyltransferase family 4 protein [archaeon]
MKKIQVYLQYPLRVSDSQYYKSMIDNPPHGVKYVIGNNKTGMLSDKKSFLLFGFLKRQIRFWTEKFNLIIPNAHLSRGVENCDLIHCAHCLSKNTDKPWVLDVESLWQLWISGRGKVGSRREVLRYLERDNCKKIIAWTEATRKDIVNMFPEVRDKVEVVYYAMPEQKVKQRKKGEELVLFFSGRHFYSKGGLHATEVMDRLTKKYPNIGGAINGAIPSEIKERYSGNRKLEFHGLMPYKDVLKLYRDADIFVYPGYSDSFGFVFMDAMAFGVPIVTVDGFARKEIVTERKTGFVIDATRHIERNKLDEGIIAQMIEKIEMLIKNKTLRNKMSKNCIREISSGKFAIKERNRKIKNIYTNAIDKSL